LGKFNNGVTQLTAAVSCHTQDVWSVKNITGQIPQRYSTSCDHLPLPVSPRTIADVSVLAILDIHAPARPGPYRKNITIGQLNQLWLVRHHAYMPQTAHQRITFT